MDLEQSDFMGEGISNIRNMSLLAEDINPDFDPPWFMRRDYQLDPRYNALDVDEKKLADQFMRDGYIVFEDVLSDDLCEFTIEHFCKFTQRNADYFDQFRSEYGYLERIINLHLALPELVDLFVEASPVLRFQDALFGKATSIYTSLYYEKGSSQSIHRDTPYFTTRPEYCYFGTWFALEDADERNGCLEVIPGGHLVPEIDRRNFASNMISEGGIGAINQTMFDAYQAHITNQCIDAGLQKVPIPIRRGSVLVWHPQLPHGGSTIAEPDRSRNSIVMHTVPEDCPVYQANVFFDPTLQLPQTAPWAKKEHKGRYYASHSSIEVMHRSPRSADSFI